MPNEMWEPHGNRADFVDEYAGPHSPALRELLRSALGTELANGYTTAQQAHELVHHLRLEPGDRLLDLGAGRGWPGARLAQRSGCRLVTTDFTWEAVRLARDNVGVTASWPKVWLAAADGTALPFRDGIFAGVVHADVLC